MDRRELNYMHKDAYADSSLILKTKKRLLPQKGLLPVQGNKAF